MSGPTPALGLLVRHRIDHVVHAYDHDPATPSYGVEAARKLGVPDTLVFKTLVILVDGRPAVAIVPVAGELDLKAAAGALGGKKAVMCPPADAQRLTGYVIGGISPLGQRRLLPTVLDASAMQASRVYVSAGRRGLDVELDPADLAALTTSVVAPVARHP